MSNHKNTIYVDVHVIQSLPPSCVNRDDTGSPKTAIYGGVRRARVSSQAWKHAMREMFKEYFDENEIGIRTKLCVEWIADKIVKLDNSIELETAKKYARDTINIASTDPKKPIIPESKKGKKEKEGGEDANDDSDAMLFLAPMQVDKIAELALTWLGTNEKPDKKTVIQSLTHGHTIDIVLFGRMVAKASDLTSDGAAQVAHAISTHKVENEYDYFTAVDDYSNQLGAAHIGTNEFNSSTLYRYANVAVHELDKLGDANAAAKAVKEFIRAFVCAMPTGKQNTVANGTPPYAVMVAIRRDQPVNLAGAFENPIKSGEGGYQKKSTEALAEYTQVVYTKFFAPPEKTFITAIGDELARLGDSLEFPELLNKTEQIVSNLLAENGV